MAKYKCAGRKRFDDDGDPYCTYESDKRWLGPCPIELGGCGRFYDCEKIGADKSTRATLATLGDIKPKPRIKTGYEGFDLVLGGAPETGNGIVRGSSIIISGPPGTGKTSILLAISNYIATHSAKGTAYTSGEQKTEDIALVANRIKADHPRVRIFGMEGDIYKIAEECEADKPDLLVLDSLQTAQCSDCSADEGSAEQARAVTNFLTAWCKRENVAAIIVCHVDKKGDLAGPKAAEHLVDVVLELDPVIDDDGEFVMVEDANGKECKLLKLTTSNKNRYGATGVEAYFMMTEEGVKPAESPKKRKSRIIDPSSPEARDDDDSGEKSAGRVVNIAEEMRRRRQQEEDKKKR